MAASSETASGSSSSEDSSHHALPPLWILRNHASKINVLQELSFVIALVPLSLLLAGCTTSTRSFRDIYILSLSYNTNSLTLQTSSANETLYSALTNPLNDTSKLVEVRVAYFGLCVLTSARNWICDSKVPNLAQSLRADNHTDPLNLLWIGEKFQAEAITSAFVFLAIILVLAAVILGIMYPPYQEKSGEIGTTRLTRFVIHSHGHSKKALEWSVSCLVIGTFAAFTAAVWQHLAGASAALAKDLAFGAIKCETGLAALALGWLGFLLVACGFLLALMGALFHADAHIGWELPRNLMPTDSDQSSVMASPRDNDDGQQGQQPTPLYPTQGMPTVAPQIDQAALNRMFYFAGQQRGMAYPPRYYDTAVRVDRWRRQTNMRRGYAETIYDEESEA